MKNEDDHVVASVKEPKTAAKPSKTDWWKNCSDDDVRKQVSEILAVEAHKIPFIGDKEPLSSLAVEYESGSPILIEKIKVLTEKYAAIRRTRADGNCFFRGFMFSYLVLESQDTAEVDRIKANVEECKKTLLSLGYKEFTFEDFFELFIEQVDSVLSGEASFSHGELVERSRDPSTSDYIVMFFRFITSGEIKKRAEFFEQFIQGLANTSVVQFCRSSVEPMGEEIDHVHITALSDALGVSIRVVYLDQSNDGKSSLDVNHHDFVPVGSASGSKEVKPFITLLYRPGYYDILYPMGGNSTSLREKRPVSSGVSSFSLNPNATEFSFNRSNQRDLRYPPMQQMPATQPYQYHSQPAAALQQVYYHPNSPHMMMTPQHAVSYAPLYSQQLNFRHSNMQPYYQDGRLAMMMWPPYAVHMRPPYAVHMSQYQQRMMVGQPPAFQAQYNPYNPQHGIHGSSSVSRTPADFNNHVVPEDQAGPSVDRCAPILYCKKSGKPYINKRSCQALLSEVSSGTVVQQGQGQNIPDNFSGYITNALFPNSMTHEARRVALSAGLEYLRDISVLSSLCKAEPDRVVSFLEEGIAKFNVRVVIDGEWRDGFLGISRNNFVLEVPGFEPVVHNHGFSSQMEPGLQAKEFYVLDPYASLYKCSASSEKDCHEIVVISNVVQPYSLLSKDEAWKRPLPKWLSLTSDGSKKANKRMIQIGEQVISEFSSTIAGSIRMSNADLLIAFSEHLLDKDDIDLIESLGVFMLLILLFLVKNDPALLCLLLELDSPTVVHDLTYLETRDFCVAKFDEKDLRRELMNYELINVYSAIGILLMRVDKKKNCILPRDGNTFSDWGTRMGHDLQYGEMHLYYGDEFILDQTFPGMKGKLTSDDLLSHLGLRLHDPELKFQFGLKDVTKHSLPEVATRILMKDKINSAKYHPRQINESNPRRFNEVEREDIRQKLLEAEKEDSLSATNYFLQREKSRKKVVQVAQSLTAAEEANYGTRLERKNKEPERFTKKYKSKRNK